MKIYTVKLHFCDGTIITMPYVFTNMKEACLYGEYSFRSLQSIAKYELEKYIKPTGFYKLK